MTHFFKFFLKLFIPLHQLKYLRRYKHIISLKISLIQEYWYDFNRYFNFSDTIEDDYCKVKLLSRIIKGYHVIEKGLTMKDTRLGFGQEIIIQLSNDCKKYHNIFNDQDDQYIHALKVIKEYEELHSNNNFKLNNLVKITIGNLFFHTKNISQSSQISITKEDYFKFSEVSNFYNFSKSRYSVRNFSNEDINLNIILKAIDIAKSAPSACNRQSWRTYVFTDKKLINDILLVQGGNRGFGHLTNKLIVLTGEVGLFSNLAERNQVFIDGGIYAMNLLYSLHSLKIATCILNCSNTNSKDQKLRSICRIKESEVFISMFACGIPPEKFKLTISKRYNIDYTNTIF